MAEYPLFLWRRLARIYPAYLAVLLGLVVIVAVAMRTGISFDSNVSYSLPALLASIFMVQAWGDGNLAVWNIVAWSVSAEWLAYLAFPLVVGIMTRIHRTALFVGLAYATLLGCLLLITTEALQALVGVNFVSVLRIVGCFLAGAAMYRIYRDGIVQHWRWNILTPLLAVAVVVTATVFAYGGGNAIWTALLMPPLILGLAYQTDSVSRWFSTRFMTYWGRVSYSLYLTHFILLTVMDKLISARVADSGLPVRVGVVGLYIVAAGLAGMAVYHLIEEPMQKRMHRIRISRRGPPPTLTR